MNWTDNAIVLSVYSAGEAGNVTVVFSEYHGKWSGFSNIRKNRKVAIGDICYTDWNSRLEDSLGNFKFESVYSPYQYNFSINSHLLVIQSTCQLLNILLADRDEHVALYNSTENLLKQISLKNYALWELSFLKYIGYGLDFTRCAVTGQKDELYYISPKTGHCVVKEAGAQYKNSLFVIPTFWNNCEIECTKSEIKESLKITGHFISKINNQKLFYRDMLLTVLNA